MPTVYIESSIISYLRQKPSADLINAARQLLTTRWWMNERSGYELVISQYVLDEIAAGDPGLAAERIAAVDGIPVLPPAPEIPPIASAIMVRAILPPRAQVDALHIAAAQGAALPVEREVADAHVAQVAQSEQILLLACAVDPAAAKGERVKVLVDELEELLGLG
jgi:hypothetical protein